MEHHEAYEKLMDFLEECDHQPAAEKLQVFLASHPECEGPWEEIRDMYTLLAKLEPVPEMKAEQPDFSENTDNQGITGKIRPLFTGFIPSEWRNAAAAVLVFALGIGTGFFMGNRNGSDIRQLNTQLEEMKETMLLTLIKQPAATDRLKAVSISGEIGNVDQEIIQALVFTLNHDPNINVRLVTIEALARRMDNPLVRAEVISSIEQQESPQIQLALAELMISLREKAAAKSFQHLLERKNLDQKVRKKLEQTVDVLM